MVDPSGSSRVASFPTEDALELREKELRDFTALCKGKQIPWFQENIGIGGNLDNPQDMAHLNAFINHLHRGGMKVNGKDNHWNNGFMGSRWCDFTNRGRTTRYAYYHPTSDSNNKTGKHFLMVMR